MAWGGVNASKLQKIVKIQKKCVRNVAGKGHRAHTDPLFSMLNILKFPDLFKLNCSLFMHKYSNKKVPPSFEAFFTKMAAPNRTKGFITEKLVKTSYEQFPNYFLPKIWNDNAQPLKSIESHSSFKDKLYASLISQYPPSFKCKVRSCPDCYPPVIYLGR